MYVRTSVSLTCVSQVFSPYYSALISLHVIVQNGSTICFDLYVHTYTQTTMYCITPPPALFHNLLHPLNPSWNAALLALHCGNVDQLLCATTGQDALHAPYVCSPWRGLYWHYSISSEAALG